MSLTFCANCQTHNNFIVEVISNATWLSYTLNLRKYALLKVVKVLLGEHNHLKEMAIEKVFESVDSYKVDTSVPLDECLSELDVSEIIEATKTTKAKLIIKFLFKTGSRVTEMINIRLSDCEPINGYMKIDLMGKGNKQRRVAIPKELYDEIRNEFGGKIYLFESENGKRLNRNNIGHQIKNAGKSAGFPNISPHSLRHARATDMLLEKDFSLKAVSKYLGHSSTSITADLYLHDEVDVSKLFNKDSF